MVNIFFSLYECYTASQISLLLINSLLPSKKKKERPVDHLKSLAVSNHMRKQKTPQTEAVNAFLVPSKAYKQHLVFHKRVLVIADPMQLWQIVAAFLASTTKHR